MHKRILMFLLVVVWATPAFAQAPVVVSTSPAQNELNVPVSTNISVTFDMDMDETTINDSTFLVNARSTGLHLGTITYDGPSRTATFDPVADFDEGEVVTVVLTTGIQSSGGFSLDSSYVWSFTLEVYDGSGTFAPHSVYAVGYGPVSVFSADLDGDGDLDLATANRNSDNVSVLLNNGDGTFATQSVYAAGHWPFSVFSADLDGDGDLDLATANYYSYTVSVLLNNGDGTFATQSVYAAGDRPFSVFSADLDGDGDLDLAATNCVSDNVSVLLNNGDGTFAPHSVYEAGDNPRSVFSADLDGDGDLDLATANSSSDNVSVLLNNGDGTFATQSVYAVVTYPRSVFSADLDGDGDLDLATAAAVSNSVYILLNHGDGTFGTQSVYAAGDRPMSVFSADLDGDGDLDLAAANEVSDNVSVLLNNGDGTFATQSVYAAGDRPYSVFSADLDGDGDLDLATANYNSDNVSVLLNVSIRIGAICGTVEHDDGEPVANVTVKVIDSDSNQVGSPVVTGSDGTFHFDGLLVGTYSVMIVTPLGYSVSPGETQTDVEVTAYPCTEVNFTLTPTITSNNCRTIGYWKHQFDVHLSGRGHAQEDSSSLETYLDLVHLHFDMLGIYTDLENYDFEDAKNVLTVKGGRLMEERAKQQLFAFLLNFASGRIGNETVISEDYRVAAEAVRHVASLLNDGDPENDELAKTICDLINKGQVIQSGIVPESPERYKVTTTGGVPTAYSLEQNYPNPFNPDCKIRYALPTDAQVTLSIYNVLGQKVRTIVDEYQTAGQKTIHWDGTDDNGNKVASGIYFYRIQAGEFADVKKMLMLK